MGGVILQVDFNEDMILPLLQLRGVVIFPGSRLYLDIGRKKSLAALKTAMNNNQTILFATQKNIRIDDPGIDDMYSIGVIAQILQVLHQPDNTLRILVEGKCRAKISKVRIDNDYLEANVTPMYTIDNNSIQERVLVRKVKSMFEEYLRFLPQIPPDIIVEVRASESASKLTDFIASNLLLEFDKKQDILSEIDVLKRLNIIIEVLYDEINMLSIEDELNKKLKNKIDENQREYYLRENMKLITDELGDSDDIKAEVEKLKKQIKKLNLLDNVKDKLLKECNRLSKMPMGSSEFSISRNYLDVCLALPWNKSTKDNINLEKAAKILDKEHFGMKKVKERILELFAVRKLAPELKGQIICIVGPPGVGKTSIARSIAKSLNKKYARISLGGVKDESDIRGHRRTYIGAMPGRIIDAIKQAGSNNPLILLDEIDKLTKDFNGDPTSALLEVLDAEQNNTFFDHYLDVPFNLSNVLFITTANDYNSIPEPLLDRMDVITLSSYTHEEKFNIAKGHLVPKQLLKNGMNSKMLKINDKALHYMISYYIHEAGVRTLERTISSIIRKSAKKIVENDISKVTINVGDLKELLGPTKFNKDVINDNDEIGLAKGLAWTSVGGETMPIEVAIMEGKGKLELTGSLGNVMKESAKIAISCIRSHAGKFDIDPDFYNKWDMHIHVPEGAIPKDGPSAGITMATAIVSALKNIPVRHEVAMTGEITLRGKVLPIGGLKEKTMAAYRAGIKKVIIPKDNESDLWDVDKVVLDSISFVCTDNFETVINNALVYDNTNNKRNSTNKDFVSVSK